MAPNSLISNVVFSPKYVPSCTRDFSIGSLSWTFPPSLLCFSWIPDLGGGITFLPVPKRNTWETCWTLSFSPFTPSSQSPDYPFFPPNIYLMHLIIFAVTSLNSGIILLRIHYSGFPQTQAVGGLLAFRC